MKDYQQKSKEYDYQVYQHYIINLKIQCICLFSSGTMFYHNLTIDTIFTLWMRQNALG